jgi:hypothetical protein
LNTKIGFQMVETRWLPKEEIWKQDQF